MNSRKPCFYSFEQPPEFAMITPMNVARRNFLGLGFSAMAGVPLFSEAFDREKPPHLIPALAAYSFRDRFEFMKGKPNSRLTEGTEPIDMKQFIRFCAANNVAAELTSYFFPPEVEDSYLIDCRREAHLNGVPIAGTAVGNQFTWDPKSSAAAEQMKYVKLWIDRAVLMGAPHLRVFAGKIPKGMADDVALGNAIEHLKQAADYAGKKGVFLGIENHDSIGSAAKLFSILDAVDNPWLGINLDSGNFRTDQPYEDFAKCASRAVNVQIKTEIEIGEHSEPTDLPKIFKLLRKGNYSGYVVLEYEEDGNPFEAVPPLLTQMKKLAV